MNKVRLAGFTLVEMLVVAPMLILLIGTLIAVIVNSTGDALVTSERNKLKYDSYQALDRLEQDVKTAVLFPRESFIPQASGQGVDTNTSISPNTLDQFKGTSRFTTLYGNAIILRKVATTKNPLDPTREIVYQKNPSGSGCSTKPYLYDVVHYFIRNPNPITTSTGQTIYAHTWWRRVILPTQPSTTAAAANDSEPPCNVVPWQKPTRHPTTSYIPADAGKDEEWASDGEDTIYGVYRYFATVPDATTFPFEGWQSPDPDWIHPYNDAGPAYTNSTIASCASTTKTVDGQTGVVTYGPTTTQAECRNNIHDPYKPGTSDSANNAKAVYFYILTAEEAAGKTLTDQTYAYFTRAEDIE